MPKVARVQDWESADEDRPAPPPANSNAFKYHAFLSYSHADEATARWLHQAIEGFPIPRNLVGRMTAQGPIPTRLAPIFRDRHELAASTDLGAEIREALSSSRFLIVLCSPAAARSRWTNAEIDMFKRHRPDGCVLAAILGGEPYASEIPDSTAEECLPPALRVRYDRRGRPTTRRADPLAADLRDSGDGRRLGLLKIIAGMLGVGLDELVQRDTLRRQRRLAWLAAASLAGMAVTSTLAIAAIQGRDEARDQRREAEGLVGFMLGDLKDKLEPIGRLDALDAVGVRALAYFEQQDKSELSDEALAQRARALTLIGEIANTRGDLDGALKRYQEAFASSAEAVRRYPDDPRRLWDHAQNVFYVGQISFQRGALDQAESSWREYHRLAGRMVELEPTNNDYRLEQVYSSNGLGAVLVEQRRYDEAATIYRSALGIAEALVAADPRNATYQRQVSNTLAWLADAREYSGSLDQALADRERQLRLLTSLEKAEPGNMWVQRHAMTARRSIGRLLASRGDLAGGLRESLAGVAISDRLFAVEPDNTEWLQANALGRFDLADLQLTSGRTAEAAATTRAACDIVDRLVERDKSVVDWKSKLRVSCLTLQARQALAERQTGRALDLSRRALGAARSSPKAVDRAMLVLAATAVGSSAFEAARNRETAVRWAQEGLRVVGNVTLKPREAVEVAALRIRAGDTAGARQILVRLDRIGYRHPALTRSRLARVFGGNKGVSS